jgi:hypothetical protein
MTQRTPNFDDVVGSEVAGAERERLRRTHDLLVHAGPPPELSPELERVPWPDEALQPIGLFRTPKRRGRPWVQLALGAAALVLVGFLVGQAFNSNSNAFRTARVVQMHGTKQAPHAFAAIALGREAADGNWPMRVTVTDLPPARDGAYYDLWLSRHGKPVALCGTFNTHLTGDTSVRMSAAYDLAHIPFDGWVVTRHVTGVPERQAPTVLTTEPVT